MSLHFEMTDQFTLAETAAQFVLQRTALRPRIGLVLGSGLGSFADSLSEASKIPFHEIPSFSRNSLVLAVDGDRARGTDGDWEGRRGSGGCDAGASALV